MNLASEWFLSLGMVQQGYWPQLAPGLIWLHAISDTVIAVAYLAIPIALIEFVRRRPDVRFRWVLVCFGVFIAACGATHVTEVWALWVPSYWFSGGVKVLTVMASVSTAVFLVHVVPKVLSAPSRAKMKAANEELERTRARIDSVLSSVADSHVLFDHQWHYSYLNDAAVRATRRSLDEILGHTLWELFPDVLGTKLETQFRHAMDERQHVAFHFHYPAFDTQWEIRCYPAPEGLAVFATDVTERMRAEETLLEYEKVVEGVEEMIAVVDRNYRYLLANRAFLKLRGMEREQVVGRLVSEVLGKDYFEGTVKSRIDEAFQGKTVKYELRYEYPAIGLRDILVAYFPIEGAAGVERVVCVLQDVTDRKRANEELRRLSRQLLRLQDEERRKIARDLHDTTGQDLVALATTLTQLRDAIPGPSRKARKLALQCRTVAERSLREVRTLSYLLHPPMLDAAGLEDAIRHFVEGFCERTGIQVELDVSRHFGRLPEDVELGLFRVIQECLTNIQRHSGSYTARIELHRDGEKVLLDVRDTGRGIAANKRRLNGNIPLAVGVGIPSMEERVRQVGGQLTIESSGGGTAVRVAVPVHG